MGFGGRSGSARPKVKILRERGSRPSPVHVAIALAWLIPAGLQAQGSKTIVGIVGGYGTTEQIWRPTTVAEDVGGLIVGAWVRAATPLGWLSIRAEGAYTQRGGDVVSDVAGQPVNGGIRSDYVTIALDGRATVGLGPLRLHVAAGPSFDVLIRSRLDQTLAPVLQQEGTAVFGVQAGVGLGVQVTERVLVEVEARIHEGLGDAYSGDFLSVRNRSREVVIRVGVPLPAR